MADLPRPIREFIDTLTEDLRAPAYLLVTDEGLLSDWGGGLESYGITGLEKNANVGERVAFLAGVLPLDRRSVFLPHIWTHGDVFADVHLFLHDQGTWVLLLDATAAVGRRQSAQQRTYDSRLRADELHERRLSVLNRQLRDLASKMLSLQEEERTRLAREIHDELGQLLTAIHMDLRWLARRLGQIHDPATRDVFSAKLTDTTKLVDLTVGSVQRISRDLRPPMLDSLGLAAAVGHEAALFEQRTGVQCKVVPAHELPALPAEVSIAAFRIFQEILTNVARHAEATKVMVRLDVVRDSLTLVAADDGRGITAAERDDTQSLGVLGMRERASILGGDVQLIGVPGAGTTVTVEIPLTGHQPGGA